MAIVQLLQDREYRTAVTLAYYANMVGYTECAINGVYNPLTHVDDQCTDIWTLPQRQYILKYFAEAQEELENETNLLFQPTWVTGNIDDTGNSRLTEITNKKPAYRTRWSNFIKMGRRVDVDYGVQVVDHTNDPALVGPILVDRSIVTNINFVKVFYVGTEIEIHPSNIYFTGLLEDEMWIEIPRCRAVAYALRNNNTSGINYADTTNFVDEVQVTYWNTVDINSVVQYDECTIGLHYLAGEIIPTVMQMDMIIKLAHAKMPEEPCGCPIAKRLWQVDHEIPEFITMQRESCPFGLNNGAFISWQWAKTIKRRKFGYIGF